MPAASRPTVRVGERRSRRVAAKVVAAAASEEERERDVGAASEVESSLAGDDASGAEEEAAIAPPQGVGAIGVGKSLMVAAVAVVLSAMQLGLWLRGVQWRRSE